jgi:hypothetical protein
LKKLSDLTNTHFSFFIDDGHNLSRSQQKTLNSWISYRDTTDVSFKVSIPSKREYIFETNTNSIILINHDYIVLDLEKEFFGYNSNFYKFAKSVIDRRLEKYDISTQDAEEFFPEHPDITKELENISKDFINGEYEEQKKRSKEERKKIVSKFKRAIYFRLRLENSKANLPTLPYTGFNTMVNISTGVIRNLLVPCSEMFIIEKNNQQNIPNRIEPKTQYEGLKKLSEEKWEEIKNLSSTISNCDEEIANKIYKFLNNFGIKLKSILLDKNSSEKQILTFTIEKLEDSEYKNEIIEILNIAEKAGLIYTRMGPGKNSNRTIWYTPNRILWVSMGLDPVGQNGRTNITPSKFIDMTKEFLDIKKIEERSLFDEI